MKKQFIDRSVVDKKIYSDTYKALELLVSSSQLSQMTMPDNQLRTSNSIGYLKEFCTIRMATSRRSGHTYAAARLALEYFDSAIFKSVIFLPIPTIPIILPLLFNSGTL